MRVTIDLERDIIIIPDNFFARVAQENEKLAKYGGKPVKAIDRIKHSFKTAMADTDRRLLTRENAKRTGAKQEVMGVPTEEEEGESGGAAE